MEVCLRATSRFSSVATATQIVRSHRPRVETHGYCQPSPTRRNLANRSMISSTLPSPEIDSRRFGYVTPMPVTVLFFYAKKDQSAILVLSLNRSERDTSNVRPTPIIQQSPQSCTLNFAFCIIFMSLRSIQYWFVSCFTESAALPDSVSIISRRNNFPTNKLQPVRRVIYL